MSDSLERKILVKQKQEVEQAYEILISNSERLYILKLCNGNEDLAQEVISVLGEDLTILKSISIELFINSKPYRNQVIRNKFVDILRKKSLSPQSVSLDESYVFPVEQEEPSRDEESSKVSLADYVDDIITEMYENAVENKLTQKKLHDLEIIIRRRADGILLKDIAEELEMTESNVSQLISRNRHLFSKYEDFWKAVMTQNKIKEKKVIEQANIDAQEERVHRVIIDLSGESVLSPDERASLVLAQWYMDPSQSEDDLRRRIADIFLPYTHHNLQKWRRLIEAKANYLPIDWGQIGRIRFQNLKSKRK